MAPASSRKQFKFMKAVQGGSIKVKNLSKAKAAEFTSGESYQSLPARAPRMATQLKKVKKTKMGML